MTGEEPSRTLYVGNLSSHVTEDLLVALFGQIGDVRTCKVIHEPGNDPYAFIEFNESHAAAAALAAMNKRNCLGKEMKVNWASTGGPATYQPKMDSKYYHVFVGDLAPDIEQQTLREAFTSYGEIADVKIMKDPHTLVHKGYGFVSFINKADAETAISQMNGQWLGTRKIRTNWATRKVQPGSENIPMSSSSSGSKYSHKLDYGEVWGRASDTNTTVYCGGVNNVSDDLIRNTFGVYGQIVAVHPFPDRGYAFVRFSTKEAACSAICGVHGMDINGGIAKCSWGKENIDMSGASAGSGGGAAASMAQSMYSTGAQGSALAAAAAAANPLQSNNPWGAAPAAAAAAANSNWAANYQWAGYPQNAMNYWQGYAGYQNPMMQPNWNMMSAAAGAAPGGANAANTAAQYQMGQYQQGANGK